MSFFDQFNHTIDDKGRLVLPAAYRDEFASGGFLTFLGAYAALFTRDGWARYERKLEQSRKFSRLELQFIISMVTPFELDKQHRVIVPARLRKRAELGKEVSLVGSDTHVAIYPAERWTAIEEAALGPDADGLTLADKLNSLEFL